MTDRLRHTLLTGLVSAWESVINANTTLETRLTERYFNGYVEGVYLQLGARNPLALATSVRAHSDELLIDWAVAVERDQWRSALRLRLDAEYPKPL